MSKVSHSFNRVEVFNNIIHYFTMNKYDVLSNEKLIDGVGFSLEVSPKAIEHVIRG